MENSSHTFHETHLKERDSTKIKNVSMVFGVLSFHFSPLALIKDYSVYKFCPYNLL